MTKADRVRRQIELTKQLYATGPLPPQFFQWVDGSLTVLRAVFGEESGPVLAFLAAAGDDVHDPAAVMLPRHTEWGTHARMERCRVVLESALATLLDPAQPA
jgi:hypothetical protein